MTGMHGHDGDRVSLETTNEPNPQLTSPNSHAGMLNNHFLGNPLGQGGTRVLLLGSGELGREMAMSFMRLGAWVGAADSYAGAPAAQVAHEAFVLDMTDPTALDDIIDQTKPDIIVPEIESLAVSRLAWAASQGIHVVPASSIVSVCMNREALRTLAHEQLGLPTTEYRFAGSLEELYSQAQTVGYPCVVKPVMSSSGHGQSVVSGESELDDAWREAQRRRRSWHQGQVSRVIVERLAPLDYELTILTVSSSMGVLCCQPIGQRQERGDYQESWQPAQVEPDIACKATDMAINMVSGLVRVAGKNGESGWGLYGVEVFVLKDGSVLFNELSPRPHDTGMVTIISQRLNEFDLHARAVLGVGVSQDDVGLCIPEQCTAASRALTVEGQGPVLFSNLSRALAIPQTDLSIFSKPAVHGRRRMGVALAYGSDEGTARQKTADVAGGLEVQVGQA